MLAGSEVPEPGRALGGIRSSDFWAPQMPRQQDRMGSEATGVRGGGLGKIQAGLEQEAWGPWGAASRRMAGTSG